MTSAHFARLVFLPVIVHAPGQYITRQGEIVSVLVVSTAHNFGCRGHYPDGTREGWHKSGRLYHSIESQNDIVGPAPTT